MADTFTIAKGIEIDATKLNKAVEKRSGFLNAERKKVSAKLGDDAEDEPLRSIYSKKQKQAIDRKTKKGKVENGKKVMNEVNDKLKWKSLDKVDDKNTRNIICFLVQDVFHANVEKVGKSNVWSSGG